MRPLLSGKGADTMATQAKLSDYGSSVGTLPSGPLGKISDVPGVTVGHCTVDTQTQKTGVTVVMPCADDMFAQKLPAARCGRNMCLRPLKTRGPILRKAMWARAKAWCATA